MIQFQSSKTFKFWWLKLFCRGLRYYFTLASILAQTQLSSYFFDGIYILCYDRGLACKGDAIKKPKIIIIIIIIFIIIIIIIIIIIVIIINNNNDNNNIKK